ncbi:pyridoxal phosphate-dependent aminotransferase [Maridesulfovibrio ferrireducens]|uniref:pyridoxal phosphate-dependent aminotransferase n=1 Tax=Maridesulfovibrio ferrireducens TaxID=246191 RepID=UPI001A1DA438|nr:pyridoxal phosphate-dependent aminotransferase [Maridesulfovibrio ferrireducens]MBI9111744.1 pyridoxal phosphate-dependent aminotransferase [Maridesulfovibrio ferrireducens]
MKLLSSQVEGYLDSSSWIRKMFETGMVLKKKFGEDAVCDFSLGNPDVPAPAAIADGLKELAECAGEPFAFGYMPNFGYPSLREKLAKTVSQEQGVPVEGSDLIITCGAAGAINALYRSILNPGDQILCPAPYFVEYGFYAQNYGGELVTVPSKPLTFELDFEGIEKAINEKTRVVLINSPNNPTGVVYSKEDLEKLTDTLKKANAGRERPIFLVADEPYRFLAFDGVEVPSILPLYPYSVVVSSFSKNLSLAGERIGYALINPEMPEKQTLLAGLVLANRILGFVNAPAVGQKLLEKALGAQVDKKIYLERRDAMAKVLDDAGYSYTLPKGAFYFFPEAPGGDDVKFCAALQEEKILAVPGTGFGFPGYFRLAFCVGVNVIERSTEGFKKAIAQF